MQNNRKRGKGGGGRQTVLKPVKPGEFSIMETRRMFQGRDEQPQQMLLGGQAKLRTGKMPFRSCVRGPRGNCPEKSVAEREGWLAAEGRKNRFFLLPRHNMLNEYV